MAFIQNKTGVPVSLPLHPSVMKVIKECGSCGCSGYAFLGNKSGQYMDLVFKEEKGRVTDIYDCSEFKADSPEKNLIKE